MNTKRYIYDALYGIIYPETYIWNLIHTPELQRLREIRLCNINSLCLTGGANVNRYEHSIGTYHLASLWLKRNNALFDNHLHQLGDYLNIEEIKKCFLIAALLHDAINGPFGHSLEYSYDEIEPEDKWYEAISGKKDIIDKYQYINYWSEAVFFNKTRGISSVINDHEQVIVSKILNKKHFLSPMINGTIDLDNIDNVYRLSYHYGFSHEILKPVELSESITLDKDGHLTIKSEKIHLIKDWLSVRAKLYKYLLYNPDEISAKCILNDLIETSQKIDSIHEPDLIKWNSVDFDLIKHFEEKPSILYTEKVLMSEFESSYLRKAISEKDEKSIISILRDHFLDEYPAKLCSVVYYYDRVEIKVRNITYELCKQRDAKYRLYKYSKKYFSYKKRIERLMNGDLYGTLCIFTIHPNKDHIIEIYNLLRDRTSIQIIKHMVLHNLEKINERSNLNRSKLNSPIIALHTILDKNKISRKILVDTIINEKQETQVIGTDSNQIIVGIFLENNNYNNLRISRTIKAEYIAYFNRIIEKCIMTFLRNNKYDVLIEHHTLYSEAND